MTEVKAVINSCTQLTPTGRGGVASISVNGDLWTMLQQHSDIFQTKISIADPLPPLHRIIFGLWRDEEIVLSRVASCVYEIHCHGGPEAVRRILGDLQQLGFPLTTSEVYLANSSLCLLEQEVQLALIQCQTCLTAELMLNQTVDRWQQTINELQHLSRNGSISELQTKLQRIVSNGTWGVHCTLPWKIAILGRPNVGKSSLLNRLLGYERSIVHDQPGTTRDLVAGASAIAGWPVELIDTAGQRETQDQIEQQGVALARKIASDVDLVLLVFDLSQPLHPDDEALQSRFPQGFIIGNKIDLPAQHPLAQESSVLKVSTYTGAGIDDLIIELGQRWAAVPLDRTTIVPVTTHQLEMWQELFLLSQNEQIEQIREALLSLQRTFLAR
jgi:tRNA modification GTPase